MESWAPEYGTPLEPNDELATDGDQVDTTVEVAGPWRPLPGRDDGIPVVAFVDGVRRVDGRLTIDASDGPVAGLCGSYAVGAVLWRRAERRSEFEGMAVHRLAVVGGGRSEKLPPVSPQLTYRTEAVADLDPASLVRHFHQAMRRAEADLVEDLAEGGFFVVADGPINDLTAAPKIGYIKSHRAPYLPPDHIGIVGQLGAGERTPMFTIGQYKRYSWYLRLADVPGGHSWSGVVRCEASAALPRDEARIIADRSAALLPGVASALHVDPRAPQNLVPIAALERELRRRLGDAGIVHRQLRAAVMQPEPV